MIVVHLAAVILFLRGKYGINVEGKETASFGENMISDRLSGKDPILGYRITIFPPHAYKGKYGGKDMVEYEEKLMAKEVPGKISHPKTMVNMPSYELKGTYGYEVEGKETARFGGQIMPETSGGKEPFLGNPFTIYPRHLKEELRNRELDSLEVKMAEELALSRITKKNASQETFDRELTKASTSLLESMFNLAVGSQAEDPLGANIDLCIKFFFSIQELPHYFAGVTDAILNATRNSLPLANDLVQCTNGTSFMESLSCIRHLEPEIRNYYISQVPLLKQPILAFREQFIKIKDELEGCLVIKHSD